MPASHPMYTPLTASEVKIQRTALAIVAVFLISAILGFIGVTTYFDQLGLWHDLTHLLFAIAGLVLARTPRGARGYLIGGGAIYLALNAFGVALGNHGSSNVGSVNTPENWLHLALGVTMTILGALLSRSTDANWYVGAGEGAQGRPTHP